MNALSFLSRHALKSMLCVCCLAICFSACYEEEGWEQYSAPDIVSVDMSVDEMKYQFASGLAKMLKDNPEAREVIKAEALKKIDYDYDYDVLYVMIKSHALSSGYTFGELLSEYVGKDVLSAIERELPTLTIFVPELPEDCFSAEIWDTETMIPEVAVLQSDVDGAVILNAEGDDMVLTFDKIPAFPVVVVKLNERITTNNYLNTKGVELNELAAYGLAFESECFNNLSSREVKRSSALLQSSIQLNDNRRSGTSRGSRPNSPGLDPRFKILKEAYKQYPAGGGGWQRDYIYYDISPTSPSGVFNMQYQEAIWGFEMLGDTKGAIDKISDQSGDPQDKGALSGGPCRSTRDFDFKWTDGEFEFKVSVYVGSKTAVGNVITKYFRIPGEDLFAMKITSQRVKSINTKGNATTDRKSYPIYYSYVIENSRVLFEEPIPLFSWDLQNYSSTIKLSVEEVDEKETSKNVISNTVEFATNFGFNATLGETVKIGPQFGSSMKESRTVSYETTTTKGNDELGDVIVDFGDAILKDTTTVMHLTEFRGRTTNIDRRPYYLGLSTRYYTGWYRIYIAPALIE